MCSIYLYRSAVEYETRRSGPQPFVCGRGRYSCTYENENIIYLYIIRIRIKIRRPRWRWKSNAPLHAYNTYIYNINTVKTSGSPLFFFLPLSHPDLRLLSTVAPPASPGDQHRHYIILYYIVSTERIKTNVCIILYIL